MPISSLSYCLASADTEVKNKNKTKGESVYVCMYGPTYSKSMDQPGNVASPARGQLNRKNEYFSVRVRA